MINLEPLRNDIQKLKEVEKADFRSTAQSKDVKWKQRVADEIGVELEEEEKVNEQEAIKTKRDDVNRKKKFIKDSLQVRDEGNQKYAGPRKNVYLSTDELKRLSEQLRSQKQEHSHRVRSQSRGVPERAHSNKGRNKSLDQRAKVRKAGREDSNTSVSWLGDASGSFNIHRGSNLKKRKPKTNTSSKKKFGKKRR